MILHKEQNKLHSLFFSAVMPSLATVMILVAVNFIVLLPSIKKDMLETRKNTAKELSTIVWDLLKEIHEDYLDGKLSLSEAKEVAKLRIESFRYDEGLVNYFWVVDSNSQKMILNPVYRQYEDLDVREIPDKAGKLFLVGIDKLAAEPRGGYIKYLWYSKTDSSRFEEKLGYVKEFKPWGWVIGTGIYIEEVKAEVRKVNMRVAFVIAAVVGLVSLINVFVIFQAKRSRAEIITTRSKLLEKESLLFSIFESAPDALCVVDDKNVITYYNSPFVDFWKIPEDIIIKRDHDKIVDYILPQIVDKESFIRVIKESHEVQKYRRDIVKLNDGSVFELRITPMKLTQEYSGRILSYRNITDAKKAEEKIESHICFLESLEKIDKVLRQSQSESEFFNQVLESLLDIFKCDRVMVVHPCDPSSRIWKVRYTKEVPEYSTNRPQSFEVPMTDNSSSLIWGLLKTGKPMCMYPLSKDYMLPDEFVAKDIHSMLATIIHPKIGESWGISMQQCSHERKWTEFEVDLFDEISKRITNMLSTILLMKDIQESELRIRTLLNALPDIVCFKDGEGRWLEANDNILKLYQLENVDYRGKRDSELTTFSPFYKDVFSDCEKTDDMTWEAGDVLKIKKTILTSQGESHLYEITKIPLYNRDGKRRGLVVIGKEISA